MPNRKPGDNPLPDFTIHGISHFPKNIENMLTEIQDLGRAGDRWPLGETWPFSPKEFDWERGKNLDEARELLSQLLEML